MTSYNTITTLSIRKFIFNCNMQTNPSSLLVLVYFKVRGKMQPIRNLMMYLGVPYVEVHLEDQEQKKTLPEQAVNCLKGVRIDKASLPLLVYEGNYIYDIYPIMAYLCRKFKREELLGRNIRQKTRLQQILEIFFVRQPNSMSEMFKLADFAAVNSDDAILKEKKAYLGKFFNDSGYLKETCMFLEQQNKKETFVLQTITIVDFLFLESCHYLLGIFNNIDEKHRCPITNMLRDFFTCGPTEKTPEEFKYLATARNFVNYMYSLPFYSNNRDYLQSFSIVSNFCSSFTPQRIQGMRKMWAYNKAFVQ